MSPSPTLLVSLLLGRRVEPRQGKGGEGRAVGWFPRRPGQQPRRQKCVVWPPREQGRKCFRSGGRGDGAVWFDLAARRWGSPARGGAG